MPASQEVSIASEAKAAPFGYAARDCNGTALVLCGAAQGRTDGFALVRAEIRGAWRQAAILGDAAPP